MDKAVVRAAVDRRGMTMTHRMIVIPETCDNVRSFVASLREQIAGRNMTGIAVMLIEDNRHYTTHQFGLEDDDFETAAELFERYHRVEL